MAGTVGTMDVFRLRDSVIDDYEAFVKGFLNVRDDRIRGVIEQTLAEGLLWPEPWLSLNPKFTTGGTIDDLVTTGTLHPECARAFRMGKDADATGTPLFLYRHQVEAIQAARAGDNYVLTTGTGSGKSLSYIIPIVDFVLREGSGRGIKAIVVYPMNALANSQQEELSKFLSAGYPDGNGPVTFGRYTGQESDEQRQQMIADPPDILLTNYVMLELILTRTDERPLVAQAQDLRFLVFDELHTYRGRQGADVALLCRRVREACNAARMQCIGTSATMASEGTLDEQRADVASVASRLFGATVKPGRIIGETLEPATLPIDDSPNFLEALQVATLAPVGFGREDIETFMRDPLARWVESTIGLREQDGQLVRAEPRTLGGDEGIAAELAKLTDADVDSATAALRAILLAGSLVIDPQSNGRCSRSSSTSSCLVVRVHTRRSNLKTSVRSRSSEQQYVPGDRSKRLFPLAFCRDGGQEYYVVERVIDNDGDRVVPRDLGDTDDLDGHRQLGFLYVSTENPWPDDNAAQLERLPADWVEEDRSGNLRVRRDMRRFEPESLWVTPDGRVRMAPVEGATRAWWVPTPFRFCLWSGATYAPSVRSDITKLSTLGFEGRSTATTMLTLGVLRFLEAHGEDVPRKLLNFTDNRQDAALQAGHFNDFVQVSLLRAGLYRAVSAGGSGGFDYTQLASEVQSALALPMLEYAQNPDAKFGAKEEIDRALREVLAYRLYVDLRAGWRVTAPNLEQTGLLRIEYAHLDELCADEREWTACHDVLATATPPRARDRSPARCSTTCDESSQSRSISLTRTHHDTSVDPVEPEPHRSLGDRRGASGTHSRGHGSSSCAAGCRTTPRTGSASRRAASSASTCVAAPSTAP